MKNKNYKLEIKETEMGLDWWAKTAKEIDDLIAADEAKGLKDMGYAKAVMLTMAFFEGIFTQKPTPNPFEVAVPKGIVRVTQMAKDGQFLWLVRNDELGTISTLDPNSIFAWAVETYPDGIGDEGYEILALMLLGNSNADKMAEIAENSYMKIGDDN